MSDSPALTLKISESPAGVRFKAHVQPRASRNEISGVQGEELKLRLTAPPVEDAANRLCIEFFAEKLGVAKSRVVITSGTKSRHKTVSVEGISRKELLSMLGLSG